MALDVLLHGDIDADESTEMSFQGDATVDNFVRVAGGGTSTDTLERDPAYSGPDYRLGGPPDVGSSPIALGFRPGDKIRLTGGGPNGDRTLTLKVPDGITVHEVLVTPDTNTYSFEAVRKLT